MGGDLTVRIMPGKGEWTQNLAKALDVITHNPGLTAYGVSLYFDPEPVPPGELRRSCFPMTGILALTKELIKDGKVYAVPNPRGQQFYPREETIPDGPADTDPVPF
jgi:hypothetical protein